MILREKKRNPRSMAMILDMLHIVVGILVVVCVVLAFLDPVKNRILFPAVFWLASFLNGVNGQDMTGEAGRQGFYMDCLPYFF